ncbi:hypothetical protein ACMDB5_07665 [Flavobacterium sp. W1B]|uniref:hypothetical protein n=1 Tax=Flavobacterium sp. W1B TaxID=3394146 RepID=UPI0039BC3BE5
MSLLSKKGIDYIPIVIKRKMKRDKMIVDLENSAVIKEKSVSINGINVGLCSHCDDNSHCNWKRNNTMFCEHYQ